MRQDFAGFILFCVFGCGHEVTAPRRAPLVDLGGHYVGAWDVRVTDTVQTCEFGGCSFRAIAAAHCAMVLDFRMLGDTTFSGTFATDTVGGCIEAAGTGLSLPTQGSITQGIVTDRGSDLAGHVAGNGEFAFGNDFRQDFERQFGCALWNTVPAWVMRFSAGDPEMFAPGQGLPGTTGLLYAAGATVQGGSVSYEALARCAGRKVRVTVEFFASRVP